MPVYNDSPEIGTVAAKLIASHHPDLASINIGYLFRDQAPMARGRITPSMCVKVDDRNHVFTGKDVLIEIGRDVWDRMDDELREVLVDHELHHIGVDLDDKGATVLTNSGRPKIYLKPHDFAEFGVVMDRYGATHERYRRMVRSLENVEGSGKQT